jgi:hypothetical protein
VITTNYDNLLERAIDLAARDYRILVQPAGASTTLPRRDADVTFALELLAEAVDALRAAQQVPA